MNDPNVATRWMAWAQGLGVEQGAQKRAKLGPMSKRERLRAALNGARLVVASVIAPRPLWTTRLDWSSYLASAMMPAFMERPDIMMAAPCGDDCGGGHFGVAWGDYQISVHFTNAGVGEDGGGPGLKPPTVDSVVEGWQGVAPISEPGGVPPAWVTRPGDIELV